MIARNRYLDAVAEIAAERPAYRLGGDGSDGTCDCVGLTIGALKRCGERWGGIHGSNWGARNVLCELAPVSSGLQVGDVVLKARAPGDRGYALPGRYSGSADKHDYYHWGVVRSASPLEIVHCTSPGGIKVDTSIGAWAYRGQLSMVAENIGEGVEPTRTATVIAEQGSSVKMRERPSTSCKSYQRVPVGARVCLQGWEGDWARISYGGRDGWMMRKFLYPEGESQEEASRPSAAEKIVTISNPGGGVNAREGNGTEYGRAAVLEDGMRLPWVATAENGWHACVYNKRVVWVSDEFSRVG